MKTFTKKDLFLLITTFVIVVGCTNTEPAKQDTPTGKPQILERDTTGRTQRLDDSASTGQSLLNNNPEQQKGSPK